MNRGHRSYAHRYRVDTTRLSNSALKTGIFTLIALLASGGCSTHLGYVPHDVNTTINPTADNAVPLYQAVRNWSFDVEDGYNSRATANRQALYFGQLIAIAGASALVGLAAFAPGSAVIIGLPIGTTFLGGTMAVYNNEQKAIIYGYASETIRDLLTQSDGRVKSWCPSLKIAECDQSRALHSEATCLHAEVAAVMKRVDDHIALLDPKNVTDKLNGVASSLEAKEALVARKQNLAAKAAKEAAAAPADTTLDTAKNEAQDALEKAQKALKEAQDKDTVQNLSAAANDFDDLKVLPQPDPKLCPTPPPSETANK